MKLTDTLKILLVAMLLTVEFSLTSVHISASSVDFPSDFPYLFVYPQSVIANVGENITVSICIFNLTSNVFTTFDFWQNPNDPYPTYAPDGTNSYPLGSLLGFDINFTWDPEILEYKSHTVTVPFEDYPNPIPPMNYSGTLYKPVLTAKEVVDKEKGKIWIAKSHQGTKVFNGNGTILQITFQIKREGGSELKIASAALATFKLLVPGANKDIIIFRVGNGFVSTPGARTRIYSVDIKAAVGTRRFNPPIIKGENASIKVTIKNDGSIEDFYNLTVYHKNPTGVTQKIFGEVSATINATQIINKEIILPAENLDIGIHNCTIYLDVLHYGIPYHESISKEIRVISGEVNIQISWQPEKIQKDQNITFTAAINIADPDVSVRNVTWEFYEHGLTGGLALRHTLYGQTVIYSFAYAKNWTVVAIVTDSFGVTWNEYRPATSNYRKEQTITVLEKIEEAVFPWDLVILAVIVIAVIIIAIIYIRRKRR
jgi:hypothetical protein